MPRDLHVAVAHLAALGDSRALATALASIGPAVSALRAVARGTFSNAARR